MKECELETSKDRQRGGGGALRLIALLWVGAGLLVSAVGCGASSVSTDVVGGRSALTAGRSGLVLPASELARIRRVAGSFARSYAVALGDPDRPRVRGATFALARELRASAARVASRDRRSRPRLLAVSVEPTGARAARAAAILRRPGGAPFSIVFDLQRRRGRWLAVGLEGN